MVSPSVTSWISHNRELPLAAKFSPLGGEFIQGGDLVLVLPVSLVPGTGLGT